MTHSLVTGGAGFIGSHLVDALVARGDRVSVLDNLSSGSLDFLAGSRDAIEFHRLDLLDNGFDAMLDGIDVVWHLSATPRCASESPNQRRCSGRTSTPPAG